MKASPSCSGIEQSWTKKNIRYMKSMEVMQYPVISVPLSWCVIFSECSVVCRDDNCMVSR
jgi:hypothetical protein